MIDDIDPCFFVNRCPDQGSQRCPSEYGIERIPFTFRSMARNCCICVGSEGVVKQGGGFSRRLLYGSTGIGSGSFRTMPSLSRNSCIWWMRQTGKVYSKRIMCQQKLIIQVSAEPLWTHHTVWCDTWTRTPPGLCQGWDLSTGNVLRGHSLAVADVWDVSPVTSQNSLLSAQLCTCCHLQGSSK